MIVGDRRNTKYTSEIREVIREMGHATNAQIAESLRKTYPGVSDTTVHRITQRLAGYGDISHAPASRSGCVRYDSNTHDHDHFVCVDCDSLRDIAVPNEVKKVIQTEMQPCIVEGPLTISGRCKNCIQQ